MMNDERPGPVRLAAWGLLFGVFFGLHIYFDDGRWWVGAIFGAGAGLFFGLGMWGILAWARQRGWRTHQPRWLERTSVIMLGSAVGGGLQFQESLFDRGQTLRFSIEGAVVMAVVVFVGGVVGREIRRRRPFRLPPRPDAEVPR